jgi:hypothetical protein
LVRSAWTSSLAVLILGIYHRINNEAPDTR